MLTICTGIAIKIMVVGQKEAEIASGSILFLITIILDAILFAGILDIVSKAVDCGL